MKMSKRFRFVEKRLDKIPTFADNLFHAITKKDVVDFIKNFKKNIKDNKLALAPLIDPSILQKLEKGFSQSDTPLYGAGEDEENSYINVFGIRKLLKGWKAYPRWAKHHTAQLQLRHLLAIHEYGVTIVVTPRMRAFLHYIDIHLRADTMAIRIPPRPVAFLTYRDILTKRKRFELFPKVRKALNQYIQDGTEDLLNKIFANEKIIGKEIETV